MCLPVIISESCCLHDFQSFWSEQSQNVKRHLQSVIESVHKHLRSKPDTQVWWEAHIQHKIYTKALGSSIVFCVQTSWVTILLVLLLNFTGIAGIGYAFNPQGSAGHNLVTANYNIWAEAQGCWVNVLGHKAELRPVVLRVRLWIRISTCCWWFCVLEPLYPGQKPVSANPVGFVWARLEGNHGRPAPHPGPEVPER